ncbi:MAG: cytochrome C [Bdellovibrionales bacterium GWC1_52_8]|nr:MAG: cytochrome C [Bdellovibrionales bacterium GWB1_52_6]OFZ05607.1 MAG: cytochrome C [Bdellovibrionales bacterium GWA1_52_35]OFZ42200.1 MAG: cytochrome C [Bdellovibrionales bacterium GWC1_52_8]
MKLGRFSSERSQARAKDPWASVTRQKSHMDHSRLFQKPFATPQAVTARCLECHPKSADDLMKTAHWTWLSSKTTVAQSGKTVWTGKKNLINNYCISIIGNWASCTQCHAGYGWKDSGFDFTDKNNIDCLVCHDGSGTYAKGKAGMPKPSVDLLAVAKNVASPSRENCGTCHFYGGGGLGVKHGDLDSSLVNAQADLDVHMGKHHFRCTECHKTEHHLVSGKFNSTYDSDMAVQRVTCTDCHAQKPHGSERLNSHTDAVACQTCHIPTYARIVPTKMFWDWSAAGDSGRKENAHEYQKIKGSFKYEQEIIPEYGWFNLQMERYLMGDKFDPAQETQLNAPKGNIRDKTAKIWPFKIHRAVQPYDKKLKHLLPPVTGGEGGYWQEFNWDKALRLGAKESGLEYSGTYGWAKTSMYWPLSHMIAPAAAALKCLDCHTTGSQGSGQGHGRMNWKALGYEGDPLTGGGRRIGGLLEQGARK